MIIEVGIKPNDVTLSWENLFSYNRKILDTISNRYFFVPQPTEFKVLGVPKIFQTKLPLHPEQPEHGFREYSITPVNEDKAVSFWVSKKDAEAMESEKIFRLMELFNVVVKSKTEDTVTCWFASESYEDVRKIKVQLIQWIPKGTEFPAQVVMPDASVTEGFAEADCKKLKPDVIIQFERFGFVRVNEVGEKIIGYYAHK
jgi:glutamyl-tRNA synthetase